MKTATQNGVATQNKPTDLMDPVKQLFNGENVKRKFEELLGKKSQGFITSVLQVVASNDLLKKADPVSVYNSAAMAATLDLPLNNNLGFAYIVPYNQRQQDGSYRSVAQFQMGYKGFIQLAQRSGVFKTISATPVYEGQLIEENPLKGFRFDFTQRKSDKVVGYAAYFELLNGFEKTLYMTIEDVKGHGKKFSQTYKKGFGLWETDFDSMAIKTVLKLLLAKFAPLSIEMQKAVITDQAIINSADTVDVTYADNEPLMLKSQEQSERERIELMIADAKNMEQLEALRPSLTPETEDCFNSRFDVLAEQESTKKGGKK